MPAQPASFCRIEIGDIEVTFVPDGFGCFTPLSLFPGSTEEMWEANRHLLGDDGLAVMSLGVLLVRTAGQLVLVDLGWGPGSQTIGQQGGPFFLRMSGGSLLDNLAQLGVRPDDVDAVVLSHLHSDHTGWLVDPATATGSGADPGLPTFSHAAHYLGSAEWDYWSGKADLAAGPAPTAEQLAVLGSRMMLIGDGECPIPGINVMATPGHTPGHLSFVISSGSERALVLGDAVQCPIQIEEPEMTSMTDVDPVLAKKTRAHIEAELSKPGTLTAGPHFADLVFGRLLKGQGRMSWNFPASQVLAVAG